MPNQQRDEVTNVQAGYILFVLLMAYILSFIDRTVMAVLIGPIRESFEINDFQYSLLHGPAFTFFYVLLGLPIARLADTKSRRAVIGVGVFCWSAMTCFCGFAKSFGGLFVMRMGVGVGEAALSPPTHSILSDVFSAKRLPVALAIYALGIPLGSGLAFIIGGWVYGIFAGAESISLPFLGERSAWQLTFITVGAPGFIIALLMLFAKEPPRKGLLVLDKAKQEKPPSLPIAVVISYIWQCRGLYGAPFIGISLLSILGYGMMTWYLEFMIRSFGVDRSVVGPQFGMMFIVAGGLGTLSGGLFVGWLERMGYKDANFRIITLTAIAWFIPAVGGPLMPTAELALWAAAPTLFLFNFYFGGAFAGLQLITPNQMRAQVSATLLFIANICGLGLGPVAIGFFTNYVFGDENMLNYSLSLVGFIVCPLAAFFSGRSLKYYRQALDEQEKEQSMC